MPDLVLRYEARVNALRASSSVTSSVACCAKMFEFTHMEEGGSVAFCHRGFSQFYDVYMQLGEHARQVAELQSCR